MKRPRFATSVFCWIVFCLLSFVPCAIAQLPVEPPTNPPSTEGTATPKSPAKDAPLKTTRPEAVNNLAEIIQLKNSQGESILLSKTMWEDVLAALAARVNPQPPEPQEWSIAGVSLEGSSDGESVTLKAVLKILLLVDGKWKKIPLKLNEGILQDQSYSGPGEATSAGIDPIQGYQWWLKGKGLHVLNLTLYVPLRKEQPSRRLQLSLPTTVVSDLKLRIPMPRISARISEQSRARLVLTPGTDGTTQIEMLGLGSELDLRWQSQPELGSVATVLQTQTSISAVVDGRTVSLDVAQKIVALQGSFNQVQVRLPTGAELLQVKGDQYKEHLADPKDPGLILVTLKETASDTSTPVELKWKVRIESGQQDQLLLQGFDVAKAKLQTGYVAVKVIGDYRLEVVDDTSHFIHRANLSSLEEAQPSFSRLDDVSAAFSFTRQPFQLALTLRPEKPLVTIKPRLFLSFANDRMELFGEYDLQFYRGRIDDVKFSWPGWKEEGWKIDPVTAGNVVQDTALDDPAGIGVKLVFPETTSAVAEKPGSNGKGFTMLLHASRPLLSGQTLTGPAAQDFSLPSLPDPYVQPADFVLVLADNLDADLRPTPETAARLQSTPPVDAMVFPKSLTTLSRRRFFRMDAPRPRFGVVATIQKQRISANTEIELTLEGTELNVVQKLSYDVAYDKLPQVLLLVPDAWLNRTQFQVTAEGKAIKPNFIGDAEGGRKQVQLVLESPKIGKFEITLTTSLALAIPPGQASKNLEVPLIQTSDADFTSTRIHIQKPKRQRLTVVSEGWTPQSPQAGASVWIAGTKQSTLTLQCDQSDATWQHGVAVPRRLVSAVFSKKGDVYCQVQYRLVGYVPRLRLTFPDGSMTQKARWMQVVTTPVTIREPIIPLLDAAPIPPVPPRTTSEYQELRLEATPGFPGRFEVDLPETVADAEHLVTVTYQLAPQGAMEFGAFRQLNVPELLTDGTPTQTFWQIQLPYDQHLWTLPIGCIPEFDWKLQSWWWSRAPRQSPVALRRWIGEAADGRQISNLPVGGTRYVFSSLDTSTDLSFRTLSLGLIVFIGASLAFVFCFILVNIPSSQHVLTFLWLGFLTTLAALWYSEPVLVLLQPALLGLVLAVLATLAQRWRNKSTGIEPVVTLGTPSDILAAASSQQEPAYGNPAHSAEPGETHQPVIGMPEAGVGI